MIDEDKLKAASEQFESDLDEYMGEWEASLRDALESDEHEPTEE